MSNSIFFEREKRSYTLFSFTLVRPSILRRPWSTFSNSFTNVLRNVLVGVINLHKLSLHLKKKTKANLCFWLNPTFSFCLWLLHFSNHRNYTMARLPSKHWILIFYIYIKEALIIVNTRPFHPHVKDNTTYLKSI